MHWWPTGHWWYTKRYFFVLIQCGHSAVLLNRDESSRSLNCYHPPVSLVGRFRLGGQVLLGIENLSLAPRWAETISTTKALVTQ